MFQQERGLGPGSGGVTEAEHLNRHHPLPLLKNHLTFVCLNADLKDRAGHVLLGEHFISFI